MSAAAMGIDHGLFGNVFVQGNGKGGVGKTTLTGNMAAKTAREGLLTLGIDVNGQGNLRRELGYGVQDNGAAFAESMRKGTPLVPISVRDNLDVVPGGSHVRELNDIFLSLATSQGPLAAFLRLAQCLQPLLSKYDIVFIDSPPENPNLLIMCLAAARWVVTPVKSDAASLEDGLTDFAQSFGMVKSQINPMLTLLGVVHFASARNATNVHKDVARRSRKILGKVAHTFSTVIGQSEATAKLAREERYSRPVYDLNQLRIQGDREIPEAAQALADDHDALTLEVLERAQMLRSAA
ncbi:AAA family ATPase (plasmid) [Streptomyces sp. NBC_01525]|uniref:ParA family protein n=1 Tax=Streptomyces sp. NBC_01525 TaxID=2903893 RepID=UPI002F910E0E